jgi:long-chain acyl-CoA synthetase
MDHFAAVLTAKGGPFEFDDGAPPLLRDGPRTLFDVLVRAKANGAATLTIDGDVRHSFTDVLSRAGGLAETLSTRMGVARGDRVAIAMANGVEWMIGFIAIAALGAVPVLVNSRGSGEEIAYMIRLAGCGAIVIDADRLALLLGADPNPTCPMVVFGDGALRVGRDVASSDAARPAKFQPVHTAAADGGAVLFTSGTTGFPKAALLSQRALAHGVSMGLLLGAMNDAAFAKESGIADAEDSILSPTIIGGPLFHLGGVNPFLRCLYTGAPTILFRKWDAAAVLDLIGREAVRRIAFVPTMYWDLLRQPDHEGAIANIRFVSSGAAPILPGLIRELTQRIPHVLLGNTYGSTETSGYVCTIYGQAFLDNPLACGPPMPGVSLRLLSEEGRDVPVGEPGEICIKSAALMDGYLGDDEATAAAFVDGWFRTGDIGFMNPVGEVQIIDRKKNMIISGGENIYCAEVERVLAEHENVLEIVAFGLPDERLGERLAVKIARRDGGVLDEATVKTYARSRLAIYKVPRDVILVDEPLPRTASGKIDRAAVAAQHRS